MHSAPGLLCCAEGAGLCTHSYQTPPAVERWGRSAPQLGHMAAPVVLLLAEISPNLAPMPAPLPAGPLVAMAGTSPSHQVLVTLPPEVAPLRPQMPF